jgi:hypothetical protein
LLASASTSCSLLFRVSDDAAGGAERDASSASDDATPASSEPATSVDAAIVYTCKQTGRGPDMVPAGDRLCIDRTVVTREQYEAFLEAGVDPASQIEGCGFNESFVPIATVPDAGYPVHGVDWCDAFTFCAWAGKRLCGAMPGADAGAPPNASDAGAPAEGGAKVTTHGLTLAQFPERSLSAWQYACQGGDRAAVYPYGNDFVPDACFSMTGLAGPTMGPTGSLPACEGGFSGLFDMVGEVEQWIDACERGACVAAGQLDCRSLHVEDPALNQDTAPQLWRDLYANGPPIGIRCCGLEAPVRE